MSLTYEHERMLHASMHRALRRACAFDLRHLVGRLFIRGGLACALFLSVPADAQEGADDAPTALSRLQVAVLASDVDEIAALEREGVHISNLGPEARRIMALAATDADFRTIRALYRIGRETLDLPDHRGYTPVMLALEAGQVPNALALKYLGADLGVIADDGMSAQVLAELVGSDAFDMPAGADVVPTYRMHRDDANAILLLAAEVGNLDSIKLALEEGADPAARAPNGWSALMLAALAGRVDSVSEIVSALNKARRNGARRHVATLIREIDFDPVQAALVGGSGSSNNVLRILQLLRESVFDGKLPEERIPLYRMAALNIGMSGVIVDNHFPAERQVEFLPPLEYDLPYGIASDRDGWMQVQRILQAEGLYSGAIDGVPGPQTFSALIAYVAPLEQILVDRGAEATRRARQREYQTADGEGRRYGEGQFFTGEMGSIVGYGTNPTVNRIIGEGGYQYIYRLPTRSDDQMPASVIQERPSNNLVRNFSVPLLDTVLLIRRESGATILHLRDGDAPEARPRHTFRVNQTNTRVQPAASYPG